MQIHSHVLDDVLLLLIFVFIEIVLADVLFDLVFFCETGFERCSASPKKQNV